MKLIHIFIALVFVLGFLASDSIAQPGLYTSINYEGVNRVAKQIIPGFLDRVRGMEFPNINDGHHRILDPKLTEIWLESFNVSINDDGITTLRITQFNVSVEFRYRYKRKWFRITTGIRATLGDANFVIGFHLYNKDGHFGLTCSHVDIDAGEASIRFLGRSIKSKFLNAVRSLFKSRIRKALLDNIRNVLHGAFGEFGSHILAKIPLRFPVGSWGSIDLTLKESIRYGFNSIIVGFSGDVQSKDDHSPTPIKRNVELPFHPTDKLFSIGISTFVFNSGFYNYYKTDQFFHMVTKKSPKGYTGPKLESAVWAKELPAIAKTFPKKDLRLIIRHGEAPVLKSSGGILRFSANIYIHVQAGHGESWDNWGDAFILDMAVDAATTIALYEGRVFVQIQDIQTKLSAHSSNIGNIDLALAIIQGLLQYGIDTAIPRINEELLPGIPIPIATDNMVIWDPQMAFPENMVVMATEIDFKL